MSQAPTPVSSVASARHSIKGAGLVVLPPSAAHVVVDHIEAPDLAVEDTHHLWRVLRLRPGEIVTMTDGKGSWRAERVKAPGVLSSDGVVEFLARPEPEVAVAFALSKGGKPEWTVQKLTELGVNRIVMFPSARSVVRWDEAKTVRNRERLGSVARSAVGQSRRVWMPSVEIAGSYPEVLEMLGACAVAEMDATERPNLKRPAIVVGPEGGWTHQERLLAPATVRLSDATLRAETASVVAGCILTGLREIMAAPTATGGEVPT